jgi:pimeloyl-ACP methyl ester carboxylesterase
MSNPWIFYFLWFCGEMKIENFIVPIFIVVTALVSFALLWDFSVHVNRELSLLEDVTGANFCSSGGVTDFDSIPYEDDAIFSLSPVKNQKKTNKEVIEREKIIRYFDSIKYPCLVFKNWDKDENFKQKSLNLSKNSGYVIVDGLRTSIIVTRSRKFKMKSKPSLIFVRIPGGPGGTSIISHFDDLIDYSSGAITIDFFYKGNGFNLSHPEPSLSQASRGLESFLKFIKIENNDAKIVLVGESLGAYLSASVLHKLSSEKNNVVDRVILLSPPFGSLKETAHRIEYIAREVPKSERYALYRLREREENGEDYGQLVYLDWLDVFHAFYTDEEGEITLYEWLMKAPMTPVLVICGTQDDRIMFEKSERFISQKQKNVDLFVVDGMGHQFNRFLEAADIRAEIDAFLN